jgi:hypothetical protein
MSLDKIVVIVMALLSYGGIKEPATKEWTRSDGSLTYSSQK